MAFGIPGSESQGGAFLGRLQYDARVGFWKIVKRAQQPDGGWDDEPSEPFKNPAFLLDLGTFEVGYIKFASPPAFLVVPFGHPIPPRPAEKMTNDAGQERNAYLPGFRSKVYNPKMFMDQDAYYFANNSKTVMDPMDAVHTLASQAPEYRAGKIPLIRVTGTTANKIEGPRGNNTYYAPVFVIAGWHDRPECFGPRTVALPGFSVPPVVATAAPTNGNGHAAPKAAPASATPPPNEDEWGTPATVASAPVQVGGADDPLNDAIPF